MIERLEATLEKYNHLQEELAKPEVLSDIKLTRQYSKEMSDLEDIVTCYKKYKKVCDHKAYHHRFAQHWSEFQRCAVFCCLFVSHEHHYKSNDRCVDKV